MQKQAILLTAVTVLAASWTVSAAQTRYITDELNTPTYAGSSPAYRVLGSVTSGDEVTLIDQNPTTQYGLIRYNDGRQHWIPLDKLVEEPSARIQLPALKQRVEQLTAELASIDDSWNSKTAEMQTKLVENDTTILSLRRENEKLSADLNAARKRVDDMSLLIDDERLALIQQWFIYGGGVAGAGLLLGLILPSIIPRRRSRDRWMN